MADSVYRVTEVIGVSGESWEAAAFARWALAGAGGLVDMEARIEAIPRVADVLDYGDFFSLGGGQAAAILLAFTAAFLTVAAVLVRRRE
jgi:hypothetical protein